VRTAFQVEGQPLDLRRRELSFLQAVEVHHRQTGGDGSHRSPQGAQGGRDGPDAGEFSARCDGLPAKCLLQRFADRNRRPPVR
jgi:hypothetical protein